MPDIDVLVRGDGIVGRSLALACARLGLHVAVRSRRRDVQAPATPDVRAYALNARSVALLRRLDVWDRLPADATTAVHDIEVRGDAVGSSLAFSAFEQHVGNLAVITDAAALESALGDAVERSDRVHVIRDSDGEAAATLVVHAEGRDADAALGADVLGERRDSGQRAIAARLVSSTPHRHVARQWFASPDILALLPLDRPVQDRSYALVWSLPSDRAAALLEASESEFLRELQTSAGQHASELELASARASWALFSRSARQGCGPGWVLVGDAAHVVHPLAGQGLNLGLADVDALVDTLQAREAWRGIGDERLLRRYVRRRAAPTAAMLHTTDGMQRLFAAESAPLRELRNNGLTLVNRVRPLKRWLAARALDSR